MKTAFLLVPALLTLCHQSFAQSCADTSRFEDAREIIRDLNRIVTPSGIQESYKTPIGGINQWVNIRGQDESNPILLFVHGGPAAPAMPSNWQFQRPMEEYFTIVNWDQRGAGKTYGEADPDSISDTIRISRYVDDVIEMAEHIRQRFKRNKVTLMAHSWGTIIGMHAVLKRPDLFHGYVGIGQVINTRENERISFEHGMRQAKAHGNQAAIRELASIAPYPGDVPITRERIVIARKWAQFYGGLSAYREDSSYYFRAPLLSPAYDDDDRCAIDAGNLFTLGRVLPEFLQVDFSGVSSFPVPVVMFMGKHDYTTPSEPTSTWLQKVEAPYKRAVWFDHSSHMIPWEEPGKTLVSLLQYVRPFAIEDEGENLRSSPAGKQN